MRNKILFAPFFLCDMPVEWILKLSLLLLCLCPFSTECLRAENGDVLSISTLLEGEQISDITLDTSDTPPEGSFWVVDKQNGNIYQVSLDLKVLLNTIRNPHGSAQFPTFVLSWGIAYRASSDTLFVLASEGADFKVKELTTSGVEVGAPGFTIQSPAPFNQTAVARGLSYDAVLDELWYLDDFNDKVVRTNLSGITTTVLSLPGDNPAETTLRGEGVAFELDGEQPWIYVSYGDVFQQDPSRVLQLKDDGEATGVEVPLTVPGPRGFQTYQIGQQLRLAVVLADGRIAEIERTLPDPVPPSQLECSLTVGGKVHLTWQNHGSEAGDAYGNDIILLRNGVPFTILSGVSTTYIDDTPLEGTSTYSLRASEVVDGPQSPPCYECQLTVGTSGIIDWIPFAGTVPFDVTMDPATGDVFVTDNAEGKIVRLDENLASIGVISSPWSHPGGIAFVESISFQNAVYENVLAVARTDGTLVKIIETDGDEVTTFPLESSAGVEGLTYMPAEQQFVFIETTTLGARTIVVTDSSGARVQAACVPPEFLSLERMSSGLTYDPLEDTFLTVFEDGIAREMFTQNCTPNAFEVNLESLGEGFDNPSFFGGVQVSENTLLVCGRESGAIFRVLIFPSGPDFLRGDFDRNLVVNLTDAIASAAYLFQHGPPSTCPDAADVNDDGILDISDPVYAIFHLYLGGLPPPSPFSLGAGKDPTFRDNLGCEEL